MRRNRRGLRVVENCGAATLAQTHPHAQLHNPGAVSQFSKLEQGPPRRRKSKLIVSTPEAMVFLPLSLSFILAGRRGFAVNLLTSFSMVLLFGYAAPLCAEATADGDELDVYKVLLVGLKTVVLAKRDTPDHPREVDARVATFLQQRLPGVKDTTIADYRHRGVETCLLTSRSDVGPKLVVIDEKTRKAVFQKSKDAGTISPPFREFLQAQGYTELSRVGFDPERSQALVRESSLSPDGGYQGLQSCWTSAMAYGRSLHAF